MIDWLIKNAVIIDGLGSPSFTGDIAIAGDRISDVGNLGDISAENVIEAKEKGSHLKF